MNSTEPVVPVESSVSEQSFHNAMVAGLARAAQCLGSQRALAFVMDLSTKQVGNIMRGGSTDPKRLWDVRAVVPSALDEIADLYRCRIVHKDTSCACDAKLSVATCALLAKAIDAELDGSEDHLELLGMEDELRALRMLIDRRLDKISGLRGSR